MLNNQLMTIPILTGLLGIHSITSLSERGSQWLLNGAQNILRPSSGNSSNALFQLEMKKTSEPNQLQNLLKSHNIKTREDLSGLISSLSLILANRVRPQLNHSKPSDSIQLTLHARGQFAVTASNGEAIFLGHGSEEHQLAMAISELNTLKEKANTDPNSKLYAFINIESPTKSNF